MPELKKAKEPFRFFTRLHLSELTGLRAFNLTQLLELIREVPDACIYHHTHRFLQQHQYLSPEPPNDFAYWVSEVISEDELGERLASIDTVQFPYVNALREEIAKAIEDYLISNPTAKLKFTSEGGEFHFIKSVSFVLPTKYVVSDLKEFTEALKSITIDSLYFHIFEARLRQEKKANDFSNWVETSLGQFQLAEAISNLDPYSYTLEDLRAKIVSIVERELSLNA